jgi:DNA mismatch endonuclease, patch repair protein
MPDVFTKEKRSQVMSRIRSYGNKDTELALAKLFRAHAITGWRRRQKHFGKPDFTFRKKRVVVFVDGCFWHGCPKHSNLPVNNRPFWKKKLTTNSLRDQLVTRTLRSQGWHVLRIWEHDLSKKPLTCIRKIKSALAEAS